MKKKTEYSNSVVMMVIIILALPIVLPPLFRFMFSEEETETVQEEKVLLVCNKNVSDTEGYDVTSSTLYENSIPQKNTINFLIKPPENEVSIPEVQQNIEEEQDTEISVRSVNEEISFFRSLNNIDFNENENSIVVTIDSDSLNLNSDNLELSSYLSSLDFQQDFYTNMGYSCSKENF